MDIIQVKGKLGVTSLTLAPAKAKDGTATDWMRNWDNDSRVQISVHNDVVTKIKAGCMTLGVKSETKVSTTSQLPYMSHIIVAYADTEGQITL